MSQLQENQQESCPALRSKPLPSPAELKQAFPLESDVADQIAAYRSEIAEIVSGKDRRLLVVLGPCSLSCNDAAIDYAERLAELRRKYSDTLCIVMRAYLEKPRTTVGWKGMLYDPQMDDSNDLAIGLEASRKLLLRIAKLGLPLATEALNPLAISYLDDLVSWVAIGARTTESQTHREMASNLPCTVGFKNGTDGGLDVAINALLSASRPHSYLGMSEDGRIQQVVSDGNASGQLVLRGGKHGTNYDEVHVAQAKKQLIEAGLKPSLVVDCSHENSGKDHQKQALVVESVIEQRSRGCEALKGVMLESYIEAGKQSISSDMRYGQSITDACIGWTETAELLEKLNRLS